MSIPGIFLILNVINPKQISIGKRTVRWSSAPNQDISPQRMRQFGFTHAQSAKFTAHAVWRRLMYVFLGNTEEIWPR